MMMLLIFQLLLLLEVPCFLYNNFIYYALL
jgi:hypothetical protein